MEKDKRIKQLCDKHERDLKKILHVREQLCVDFVQYEDGINEWEIEQKREIYKRYPILFPISERRAFIAKMKEETDKSVLSSMQEDFNKKKAESMESRKKRVHAEKILAMEKRVKVLFNEESFRSNCTILMEEEKALKQKFDQDMEKAGYEGDLIHPSAIC